MKAWVVRSYFIIWGLLLLLFINLVFTSRLRIFERNPDDDFVLWDNYEYSKVERPEAILGVKEIFTFDLSDISDYEKTLCFYSAHTNIQAFVDGEQVYNLAAGNAYFAGKSPGYYWNFIDLYGFDKGKKLEVVLEPVYKNVIGEIHEFYYGDKNAIVFAQLKQYGIPLILSILCIVIGIFYVSYALLKLSDDKGRMNMTMLGFFAIQLGLWKLFDAEAFMLLIDNAPYLSLMPFLSLMLMCIPFILFLKSNFTNSENPIWYILCVLSELEMVVGIIGQSTGLWDFRDLLWVTHAIIVTVAVVTVIFILREHKKFGINGRLKQSMLWMFVCFVGALVDVVIYYVSGAARSTVIGMLTFSFYVIMLGVSSLKETRELVAIGVNATRYKDMAYHDQLTNLWNRTAYAHDIMDDTFVPDGMGVAMMDANNLKYCNDNFGHDQGDVYIKACADAIQEYLGDIGRCYRVGGDEFCVLINPGHYTLGKERIHAMKEKIENNREIEGFKMHLSCGTKLFDRQIDYDISDTVRRADREMYQEKYLSKKDDTR
ncbi:MAG: GGDEF domain-containing protein [Lachnospiraceae bacterium]|nr:GGDEF domain-containing protein [Lachnospiraceae bacterium]